MTSNVYDSFLEATRHVFQLMLDLSDLSERPADSFICDNELDISIGIVGDLRGQVIYRFPHKTSLGMVNIMSGMDVDTVDDFVISAISEVANIISGNVLTLLADNNLQCDLLPPVLHQPGDDPEYTMRISNCIITKIGDVCLDIRLNPVEKS